MYPLWSFDIHSELISTVDNIALTEVINFSSAGAHLNAYLHLRQCCVYLAPSMINSEF